MGLNPRSVSEGWREVKISDVATVIRGASPRPKGDPRFYGGPIPRLMVEDVTRDGKVVYPSVDSLTVEGAKRSRPCPAGTLTLVCSGTVGVPSFLGVDACIHDGFIGLVNVNPDFSSDFIFHQLLRLQADFDASATHGGVFTNLTTKGVGAFSFHAPESLHEQQAIAAALSDADGVVAGLERVIAKKRLIKQGAMQDLLTARRRLPRFSGEWKPVNLARESHLKARIGWQGLTTDEYRNSGEYHLITGTEIIDGRVDWRRCVFVDKWRYDQDRNIQLRNGDVLLTKDGTIGKVAQVRDLPGPAALNSGVFIIRPKSYAYDALFLFHILRSSVFDTFLAKLTAGSTIVHLYQKDLNTFEFQAPSLSEQRAIAEALDDMDAEIQTLEARLAKARAVKEGMMQNLLTGRVRLV